MKKKYFFCVLNIWNTVDILIAKSYFWLEIYVP